jgi:hypothetical protein
MGQGIVKIAQAVMRELLLLPPDWRVTGMFYDFDIGTLLVSVEHPSVPQRDMGENLPVVTPHYSQVQTTKGRTVNLVNLVIEDGGERQFLPLTEAEEKMRP